MTIGMVKPDQIVRRRTNYRAMDTTEMETLKSSIGASGFKSFILVAKGNKPGEYEILDGHHRWQAAQDMEMPQVPVVLLEGDENEKDLAMLSFNVTASILPEVYLDFLSEMNDRVGPEVLARFTAVDQDFLSELTSAGMTNDELLDSLRAETGEAGSESTDRSRGHGIQLQFPRTEDTESLFAWVCSVYEERNPALAILAALREMRATSPEDFGGLPASSEVVEMSEEL